MNVTMETVRPLDCWIRELLGDLLHTAIAGGAVTHREQADLVERLLLAIEHEDDPANCAYVFGLLAGMHANGMSKQVVTDGIARRLKALRPAGQAQAIAFIGTATGELLLSSDR